MASEFRIGPRRGYAVTLIAMAPIIALAMVSVLDMRAALAEDPRQPLSEGERVVRIEQLHYIKDKLPSRPGHWSILVVDTDDSKETLYFPIGTDETSPILEPVKRRKAGDMFRITTKLIDGQDVVQTIELAAGGVKVDQPSEAQKFPNRYEFSEIGQEAHGRVQIMTVTLSRDGQSITVMIPNRSGPSGLMPDPALSQRSRAFSKGDLVEATFSVPTMEGVKPQLQTIEPFVAPIEGVYVGPDQATVDDKKTPGVRVRVDDKDQTIPLATIDAMGKPMRAPPLPDKFAPGETLQFQLRKVGDRNEVKDVRFVGEIDEIDDHTTKVQSGGAYAYFNIKDNPIHISAWMTGGPDDNEKFLEGVYRALMENLRPAGLTDRQMSHMLILRETEYNSVLPPQDESELRRVFIAYVGADTPEVRDQAQQTLFWAMNIIEQRFWAKRDVLARQLSAFVSQAQFQALVDLAGAKGPGTFGTEFGNSKEQSQ